MSRFTLAAAQHSSVGRDFERNIEEHLKSAEIAAENKVDVIVFPELSLTGYEPESAQELALCKNDTILKPLVDASDRLNIALVAGCPVRSNSRKPYIGALIIQPIKPISIYRKQYLHTGEERYFMASEDNAVFFYKGESIGIAICADIDNPMHATHVKREGATIYLASVLVTPTGIDQAAVTMSNFSVQHNMLTVMANHASNTGDYTTAGKSAIWGSSGKILAMTDGTGNALVIASRHKEEWAGRTIRI